MASENETKRQARFRWDKGEKDIQHDAMFIKV